MDLRHYFSSAPIGSTIYDPSKVCVQSVVAHIEGVWSGSQSPWYGILTEPIMPTLTWWKQFSPISLWGPGYRSHKEDHLLLEGSKPAAYFVHCLNGGSGRSFVRVHDIKLHRIGSSAVLELPYGHKDESLVYTYASPDELGDGGYETANFLNGTFFYTSERKRNTREQERLKDTASYLAYLKEQEHDTD